MLHNFLIFGVWWYRIDNIMDSGAGALAGNWILFWSLDFTCPGVELKPWGRMGIGTPSIKKHVTYHQ